MKELILFAAVLLLSRYSIAQESPGLAPETSTFALSRDVTGVASKSVNLFTGDVMLPINLVSVAGRNGLNMNVGISYSSNVESIVNTWNLEAPTGILGLGWSLEIPKIIADHKQTGTREDDDYYLVEGGVSNHLIRTTSGSDVNGSYNIYEAKNYKFWKIKFYHASTVDKWEIIKEDGNKYIYGDKNSGRSTVQYVVRWNNWIGNSAQVSNQNQISFAWNISEIVNQWGDKLTFEYLNLEQFVGSTSGQKQTEASYIKEIVDPVGKKIQFFYNEKQSQYYSEPHTEQNEPDGYQEFYEKKYLDHLEVFDESSNRFLSIHFGYGSINDGTNSAKMLLTSIEQRGSSSTALPQMKISYFTDGATKGFLKTVQYPTGGVIAYDYKANSIGHSNRKLKINRPEGYAEPRVWIENDYAVVAWRKLSGSTNSVDPQSVRLYVYQWVGEWKEQYLQTIPGITSDENFSFYLNFQIETQANFFSVLAGGTNDNYTTYLYYKDFAKRGQWKSSSYSVNYGEGTPSLLSGTSFVVIGSFKDDSTHPCYRYVFNGDGWTQSTLNQTGGDHYYTSTNNYFLSHNRSGVGGPEINFNYLSEDKKWYTRNISTTFSSDDKSYWHGSNSYAVAMADDNPEYIYSWDVTYTNFSRNSTAIGTWTDNSYVFNINNSLIAISELGTQDGKMIRFDGSNWISSEDINPYSGYRAIAFGDDMAIWAIDYNARPVTGRWAIFNPNQLIWSYTNQNFSPNTSLYTPNLGLHPLQMGVNFLAYNDKGYFRKANGSWDPDYSITAPPNTTIQALTFAIPSSRFFLYNSTGTGGGPVIQFMNNGVVGATENLEGSFTTNVIGGQPGASQRIVWANATMVATIDLPFSNSDFVNLYAVINKKASGYQVDYPVASITAINETETRNTCFDYNVAKAVLDPSGNVAMYNEVTVIPGSLTKTERPNGYSKTFFQNGLSSQELFTSSLSTDLRWLGSPYETQVYDANDNLISYSKTTYSTYTKDLLNSDGNRVDVGYYVRPTSIEQMTDGIVVTTINSYDTNTGLVTQTATNGPISTQTSYKYFWEAYDPTRSKNILTPIVSTKMRLNGQDTEANAVRYKSWSAANNPSGVFAPCDEYTWKGTGSPDFSVWDIASYPPADWVYAGKVSIRENVSGNAIESVSPGGLSQSIILNMNKTQVLAQVSNAQMSEIAFTGFEDNSSGNFEPFVTGSGSVISGAAKTGDKYFNLGTTGITKTGLNASETYKISFWAKPTNGTVNIDGIGAVNLGTSANWMLFEYEVTGLTSVNIKRTSGTVLIDDVRLHPRDVSMSTFTHHPVYGNLSTTNQNNQVIYTEYDEWGRPKNRLDEDGNILTTQFYNYKN